MAGDQRQAGMSGFLIPFMLGVAHIVIILGHVPSAELGTTWQGGNSLQDIVITYLVAVGFVCVVLRGVDGDEAYAAYLAKINHETFKTVGWLGTGAGLVHLYQWYFFLR